MDRNTYMDPQVAGLINEHYIPVRVNQDANPDLANRYGDYGWPATIVFSPNGNVIVKRRGYIPAVNMASMLQAIIDDPSPGPSVLDTPKITPTSETSLQDAQRDHLETVYFDVYDAEHGMRYLASPILVESEAFYPGILLADHEINHAAVHITVVGSLNDKAAQSLYTSALAYPVAFKRQEWWDKQRGELLNQDIEYPDVELAAAFACAGKTCSLPVYDPAGIAEAVDRISSSE